MVRSCIELGVSRLILPEELEASCFNQTEIILDFAQPMKITPSSPLKCGSPLMTCALRDRPVA